MFFPTLVSGLALFAASATAQLATYKAGSYALSVNVPSDSASSGSGPIYFQISAPSGTSWVAFGQGSRMSGANMFVVYAKDSSSVTLSGRAGSGHNMPQYDSSIELTLLDGSGIDSSGNMVANVRCDNCNKWSGGSMSFTSSSSSWIYAAKSGSAMDTDDVSASISQHGTYNSFSLDLTSGTGGSSLNPFVASSDSGSASSSTAGSAAAGTSQTASATRAVSTPSASSGATSSTSSQETTDPNASLTSTHGIIMTILFLGCFPLFALTLYLPTTKKVRFIHAPLQGISLILLIIGLATGVLLGSRIDQLDGPHMIIGFVVTFSFILFQPAMGIYQHLYYHRTGGSSMFGMAHRWLGRSMMALGIVNGGLGWQLTGTTAAYVPYGIVAGIITLIYIGVVTFAWYRGSTTQDAENEKLHPQQYHDQPGGYEMQNQRDARHARLGSDPDFGHNAYAEQQGRNQGGNAVSYR